MELKGTRFIGVLTEVEKEDESISLDCSIHAKNVLAKHRYCVIEQKLIFIYSVASKCHGFSLWKIPLA